MNNKNIKHSSRNTYLGAVFVERFIRNIRDLLKRTVFGKGKSKWSDVLPTITKKNKYPQRTSSKLTPSQDSVQKNQGYVNQNLLDKRKKTKAKFQVNDSVTKVDLRQNFSN